MSCIKYPMLHTSVYFRFDPVYNDPLLYITLTRILLLPRATNNTILQNKPERPSPCHSKEYCQAGLRISSQIASWALSTETEQIKLKKL